MQHPDNDKSAFVGAGQLLEGLIPGDHCDVALMSFHSLVHGEGGNGGSAWLRRRGWVEFDDFEQSFLTATGDPALVLVPGKHVKLGFVGQGYLYAAHLLAEVDKHYG